MNFDDIFLFNWTSITSYFHPVVVDIVPKNISFLFEECISASRSVLQFFGDNLSCPIEFTNLQIILLTIFLGIILVNFILIAFFWNKYGDVIYDRFIRPSECFLFYWFFQPAIKPSIYLSIFICSVVRAYTSILWPWTMTLLYCKVSFLRDESHDCLFVCLYI